MMVKATCGVGVTATNGLNEYIRYIRLSRSFVGIRI